MEKATINKLNKSFEESAYEKDGVEYWLARDLQELLGYSQWRNFLHTIEKAKESCENTAEAVWDHFADVSKTLAMPNGASKVVSDIMLTRYACYLIAQNGDPQKEQIAFAQSYFAFQTRKQELLEERIQLNERIQARDKLAVTESELSKIIFERGVDHTGFANIRSKGDLALFGISTILMKKKLGIPSSRPLADFLPTITITAKQLATEITNFNVTQNDLHGEISITKEHVKNNKDVRVLLGKSGIMPEQLPADEDIKKLERRVKSIDKGIEKKKLKGK
jgi:DNA-damage-inducible protein D